MKRLTVGLAAVATAFFAATAVAAAPVIENGGFETGDFTGWSTSGGSEVTWFVYSEADATGLPTPPRGTYAAGAHENGPSTPILTQHFRVPKHATLKLFSGYDNNAGFFATPHELNANRDAGLNKANQQYRIDVMRASAPLKSLDKKDVLVNVFRTKVGDPNTVDPEKLTADLSGLAGRRVYIRFAAANNQEELIPSIDGVKVVKH